MPVNPYATLGLAESASSDDVRRAYRERAKALHPDVNTGPDAAAQFAAIQDAYETLADPRRRQAFDESARGEVRAPASAARRRANGHTNFSNIAAPPTAKSRVGTNGQHANGTHASRAGAAADAGDPTGFDEIYEAFFAPRAAAEEARAKRRSRA
ncbi:MAG: J domain-containing protein [Phycisphaerales bacterium]